MSKRPPLITLKNIKDAQVTNAEHLSKINTLLGTQWTLDIDFLSLYQIIEEKYPHWKDTVGDVTTWYMNELVDNLKSFVGKDEDYKEILVDEISANKIQAFKVVPAGSIPGYNKIEIIEGVFVIVVPEDRLGTNVGEVAQDLERIL